MNEAPKNQNQEQQCYNTLNSENRLDSNSQQSPKFEGNVPRRLSFEEIPNIEEQQAESDKEFLKQFELDPTVKDDPLQNCFKVGDTTCIPKGDQSAIKGDAKNGKTHVAEIFMGAALKGEYIGVKCLIANAKLLYIDTEQHPRNTRLVYRRVCQIAGINGREKHERINMLTLRLADDVETIRKAIRLKIKYFRPDIVFLDGIVDCVVDFNDPTESKAYVTEISKLALKYNCAIISNLHTNPDGTNKMRGHLGTFLAQKASDVIQCKKQVGPEGSIFEVWQTENRNNADFEKFYFVIETRRELSGEFISVPVDKYISVQERKELDELFRWALKDEPLRRADLAAKLEQNDCPQKMKRSTAYKRINVALSACIITDDDPVTYRLRYIGLNQPNDHN